MKNQALYIKKTWFTRLSGCPRISSSDNLCQSEGGVKIHTNLWTPCWRELSRKLLIREAQVYLWIPLREGVRSIYRGQVNLGSKVQYLFFLNCTTEGRGGAKGGDCKHQNKEHRTFDPRIALSSVCLEHPTKYIAVFMRIEVLWTLILCTPWIHKVSSMWSVIVVIVLAVPCPPSPFVKNSSKR